MDFYFAGESIECNECEIVTRKYVISSAILHPQLGRLTKYIFNRNCSTKNIKELKPKKWLYKATSNVDFGDELKGECIFLLIARLKPLKWSLINESGRHKANSVKTEDFTFAEIKYPFEHILNAVEKRKEIS